jgi:hypothetical protein
MFKLDPWFFVSLALGLDGWWLNWIQDDFTQD